VSAGVTPNRVTAISHDERVANISHLNAGLVCLILIILPTTTSSTSSGWSRVDFRATIWLKPYP